MNECLLTVGEVADRLKISRVWVYRLVNTGELKSVTIGRLRRIPESALLGYIDQLKEEASASAAT